MLSGYCPTQLKKCIKEQMFLSVISNTKISTNVITESPILTSQTISNVRKTCKEQTNQSQLRDSAMSHQGIEMVFIQQIYRTMRKKLHNLPCQTGNFATQQSCATKMRNIVTCLTWAKMYQCKEQNNKSTLLRCSTCIAHSCHKPWDILACSILPRMCAAPVWFITSFTCRQAS